MIKIRKLEEKDIPFMIEWMQDKELTKYMHKDFSSIATYDIQKSFIETSFTDKDKSFAIVDDNDEYLGSVSLKNIDLSNYDAEFAICVRKKAQGKKVAYNGTVELLKYGFGELKLKRIYLNTPVMNERSNGLYKKVGFVFDEMKPASLDINGVMSDINWYSITNDDFYKIYNEG